MLKITVLGLISAILTGGLLGLKFVAYDLEDESAAGVYLLHLIYSKIS